MMRLSYLKTHWTPEEAQLILTCFDDLRDALWGIYGKDIIEYCHQQGLQENETFVDIKDDDMPF